MLRSKSHTSRTFPCKLQILLEVAAKVEGRRNIVVLQEFLSESTEVLP